jgi:hypothetical protein
MVSSEADAAHSPFRGGFRRSQGARHPMARSWPRKGAMMTPAPDPTNAVDQSLIRAMALALILIVATPSPAKDWAIVPDPTLTPGAVRTTNLGDVCALDTRELRHWSRERDDRILSEYGLPTGPLPNFEIDHLTPLCLGGADDDRDLWPQPRQSIEPEWYAERKDDLEARLC